MVDNYLEIIELEKQFNLDLELEKVKPEDIETLNLIKSELDKDEPNYSKVLMCQNWIIINSLINSKKSDLDKFMSEL